MQIKLSSRCRPPDCVDWEDCGRRTEDCRRPMSSVQRLALLAPKERSPRPTLTIVSQPASQAGSQAVRAQAEWSMTEFVFDWKQLVAPSLGLSLWWWWARLPAERTVPKVPVSVLVHLLLLALLSPSHPPSSYCCFSLIVWPCLFVVCSVALASGAHKENLLLDSFCVGAT